MKYLSTGTVARELGVSDRYVRLRCERGEIPGAFRLNDDRGHWRIPRSWLQGLIDAAAPKKKSA